MLDGRIPGTPTFVILKFINKIVVKIQVQVQEKLYLEMGLFTMCDPMLERGGGGGGEEMF